MDKLSFELVEHIAAYINAGDALNLATTSRRIRAACHSRLDPERYLQPTFKYARYLLAAMTDYGCILSGSRALEYFVPGSIDDPEPDDGGPVSDWDFLVPCFSGSVYGMMDTLARCGVQWQNPMTELFALVGKPAGSSVVIRTASIWPVTASHLAQDSLEPPSPEALAMYRRLHSFVYVHTDPLDLSWVNVEVIKDNPAGSELGSNYSFEEIPLQDMQYRGLHPHTGRPLSAEEAEGPDIIPTGPGGYHSYGYAQDNTIHLINGYITPPGGLRQKVQLFQCHRDKGEAATPLEYVVNTYYATHVQCFISGWAAGHFYYDLARQRLSLIWGNPVQNATKEKALQTCVQKYRSRGYRFFRPDVDVIKYNRPVCAEYADDLRRILHDDKNPAFRKAVYTPDNAHIDPMAFAVADVARKLSQMSHVKPSLMVGEGLRRPQPPPPPPPRRSRSTRLPTDKPKNNPDPLSTIKTGRLSDEGYAALKRDGGRVHNGKLGMPGTKLIRFHQLQAGLREATRTDIEAVRAAPKMRAFYRMLEGLLCQFRYLSLERPVAVEVLVGAPIHWGATDAFGNPKDAPNLSQALTCATIGGGDLGTRGAPPGTPTRRFDSSCKEWRYYELLVLMTATACQSLSCHRYLESALPPQI
ncbi:hypothetical protein Sste5346_007070 [Sporothrix stenoceras]|uniref:F-box domain-containing protein n=1 Tax=Sporothrix stenoceras TaxID=5173 RepID=A0ABR3YWP4_9PEZI